VLVRQIAGVIARRIVCVVRPGDEVKAGQRLGMVKFGSRLEVLVPADAAMDVYVKPGEAARAGTTVLGVMR
jgi:phosphatidylserine decarboxylase